MHLRFKFNLHRTRTAVVRTQFPLLPAFAITCNRAQCQTLDFVGFDATVPVFSHGSLFVALSRARRAADVALFVGSDRRACDRDENGVEHAVAINVVFPSLIEDALQIARLQRRHRLLISLAIETYHLQCHTISITLPDGTVPAPTATVPWSN